MVDSTGMQMTALTDFAGLPYEMQKCVIRAGAGEIDADRFAGLNTSIKRHEFEKLFDVIAGKQAIDRLMPDIDL